MLPFELTVRLPHLKRLTLPDLALRLLHDPELKRLLAEAAIDQLAPGAVGYEDAVMERFDEALTEIIGPENHRRYHITCGRCPLSYLFEAENWRSVGVKLRCCVCGTTQTVAMPDGDQVVACGCGNELLIKLVDSTV